MMDKGIVEMTTLQELHDRTTRGLALSDAEQTQLDEWYAQQDETENNLLVSTPTSQTVMMLQVQIKAVLTEVAVVTQYIQDLMRQNEELRREVAALNNQLTKRLTTQGV